jgi:hypothetical protein
MLYNSVVYGLVDHIGSIVALAFIMRNFAIVIV